MIGVTCVTSTSVSPSCASTIDASSARHPLPDGGEALPAGRRHVLGAEPLRVQLRVALAGLGERQALPVDRSRSRQAVAHLQRGAGGLRDRLGGLAGAAQRRGEHGRDLGVGGEARRRARRLRPPDRGQLGVAVAGVPAVDRQHGLAVPQQQQPGGRPGLPGPRGAHGGTSRHRPDSGRSHQDHSALLAVHDLVGRRRPQLRQGRTVQLQPTRLAAPLQQGGGTRPPLFAALVVEHEQIGGEVHARSRRGRGGARPRPRRCRPAPRPAARRSRRRPARP